MTIKYLVAAKGVLQGVFKPKYTEIYEASGVEVALFEPNRLQIADSVNGEGLSDSEILNIATSGGKVVISQAQAFSLRYPRPTASNRKDEIMVYCDRNGIAIDATQTKAEMIAAIADFFGESVAENEG